MNTIKKAHSNSVKFLHTESTEINPIAPYQCQVLKLTTEVGSHSFHTRIFWVNPSSALLRSQSRPILLDQFLIQSSPSG